MALIDPIKRRNDNTDIVHALNLLIESIDPLAEQLEEKAFSDNTDVVKAICLLALVVGSGGGGSFALTDGSGTTADGTAVDLGGILKPITLIATEGNSEDKSFAKDIIKAIADTYVYVSNADSMTGAIESLLNAQKIEYTGFFDLVRDAYIESEEFASKNGLFASKKCVLNTEVRSEISQDIESAKMVLNNAFTGGTMGFEALGALGSESILAQIITSVSGTTVMQMDRNSFQLTRANTAFEISNIIFTDVDGWRVKDEIKKKGLQYNNTADYANINWGADDLHIPSIKTIRDNHRASYKTIFEKSGLTAPLTAIGTSYVLTTGMLNTDKSIESDTVKGVVNNNVANTLAVVYQGKSTMSIRVVLDVTKTSGAQFVAYINLRRKVDNSLVLQAGTGTVNSTETMVTTIIDSFVDSSVDPFTVTGGGFYLEIVNKAVGVYNINSVKLLITNNY